MMRVVDDSALAHSIRSLGISEPRVVVAGNHATPHVALDAVVREFERLRLFGLNAQSQWPRREGIVNETPFVGPGVRGSDGLRYLPARLSLVPRLIASSHRPDVVIVHTSPPRLNKVSLGIEVNILPSAIDVIRRHGGLVVAQMNPAMPYTFGDGEINLDDIDLAIEVEEPLSCANRSSNDDVAHSIAERVAHYVADGNTLQLGIGQVPDATLEKLTSARHLKVWSEMISDGVLGLERAGALDIDTEITTSFLFGTSELYEWAHLNPRLRMRRTEIINDPVQIESKNAMAAINAAIEIDIFAQANASHVAGHVYSGFGGQPDFVAGALHSRGGHAIITVRSWHDKSDSSCVIPLLGSPVCTFQHSVLVSEHGTAEIFGRTIQDQARLIIDNVADARARDQLDEYARTIS